MRFQEMIETVDTHTGGEPTRIISQRHPQVGGKFCPGEAGLFQGTL